MAQNSRPSATNAEPAGDVSAGSLRSAAHSSKAVRRSVDLLNMTDRERECHLSGYLSGVLAGIDIGREQMDNELGEIQRRAFGIVQAMSKLSPWDEAQQTRRQHQDKAAEHHRAAGQPWPLEVAS